MANELGDSNPINGAGLETAPASLEILPVESPDAFINHFVFREIGDFFVEVATVNHWQSLINSIQSAIFENLFATVLVMMVFLFGVLCYQRLLWFSDRTVKLAIRDEHISSYNVSRLFLSTFCAALICWSPLLIIGCYLRWNSASSLSPNFQQSLGNGLIAVYFVTVTLRLLQEFFSKGGLSEAIYGLQYLTARYVLNRVEMTILFVTPLIFAIVFTSGFADGRWYHSLGRISFLLTMGLFFSQFHQLCWPASKLYDRLLTDDATVGSAWVRHRVSLYVIGVSVFLLAAGLTVSGWFSLAKTLSINTALTLFAGVIAFTIRTIVGQKAAEMIRHTNLIQDLGRSPDGQETVRNRRVQDFVRRYSGTANRGVSFIAMSSFLVVSYWIWRDWISLPPELLNIQIGGVALAGLISIAKLAAIGLVTWYLAAELPSFVLWCLSQRARASIANPALVSKLIAAAIVYVGIWLAVRSIALELPVIPWLGTLLTMSILFAARHFIGDGFAGLVLLFDPRVGVGDSIEVEGRFGRVESVNLFTTVVEDNLGTRNVLPNSTVIHSTIVKSREQETVPMLIDVSIPRDADAHQAQALMMLVAQREPSAVSQPPPHVRFVAFRPHELRFQIRLLVLANADFEGTKMRLEEKLAIEFDRHEIEPSGSAMSVKRKIVSYPDVA